MIRSGSRVDALDGLRGIAILLVLWFHTWQLSWLRADVHLFGRTFNFNFIPEMGFFGVDLFFFLSGCVLFYPYARHLLEGRPLQTVAEFAYRRAIKILPSYFLSIALIVALLRPDVGSTFVQITWQFVSHAAFVFNWWPQTSGAINGVYWTLGVEVQFYVLFPLVSWAFRRRPIWTFAAMCCIAIAWRAWVHGCCQENGYRLLDQLPAYLDVFACGMMAAYLCVFVRSRPRAVESSQTVVSQNLLVLVSIGAFVAFGALMLSLFKVRYQPDSFDNWQWINRIWLALTFLVLGVGSSLAAPWWRRLLANPILVFFATISYNLYIYHQVIADRMYYRFHFPRAHSVDPHQDPSWQLAFTLASFALTIAFSSFVTYAFERPLLRDGPRALLVWRYLRKPAAATTSGT